MATIYPTWNRFTKLWKTVIYPELKRNIDISSWDQPSVDEEYEVSTKDVIDDTKISILLDNLQEALIAKGYDVDYDSYDDEIVIKGADRYAPEIRISISTFELDDDVILDWDDSRWTTWVDEPQDDFGFNLRYSEWIKDHGIVDTYENIRRAPDDVQESYCDWIRSTDFTRLWITLTYVE